MLPLRHKEWGSLTKLLLSFLCIFSIVVSMFYNLILTIYVEQRDEVKATSVLVIKSECMLRCRLSSAVKLHLELGLWFIWFQKQTTHSYIKFPLPASVISQQQQNNKVFLRTTFLVIVNY